MLIRAMQAPTFFLTAVGTGRVIGGPPGPGIPLLLIFHGHAAANSIFGINAAIRDRWPSTEQLLIASVVDLHHIPRYMRPAVELTLADAYRQSAQRIPKHLDPTEHVMILPDWEGQSTRAFAMQERVGDIGVALVTAPWTLFGSYTGPDQLANTLKMIEAAIDEASKPSMNAATSQ